MELVSGAQQLETASMMSKEGRVQRRQMDIATMQKETDRKERLARALASQNAQAGASGIKAFEGSPLSVLNEDISREKRATERADFNNRIAKMTHRSRTRSEVGARRFGGQMSLLKGAGDVAAMGSGGGL